MAWIFKLTSVLSVLVVCGLDQCSAKAVAQSLTCYLPNSTVAWESNPDNKTVDVEWQYGLNFTCHTMEECYGVDNETQSGVQLHPVQLQKGNKLRFHFKRYVNTTYPHVYKVNATAFRSCDVSLGQTVRVDNGSNVFDVPPEFLEFGNNHFIVATNYKAFISCDLGLRLNVTVKAENCTGNETSVCGGRGLCVTNRHQDNFACHCCGTYKGDNCSVNDACLSSPCHNGGECVRGNGTNNATTNGYQCKCAIGYYGNDCEHKTENMCDLIHCHNEGVCSGNSTTFNCTCATGWTGSQCEVDINDCASMPCRHGYCVDRLNGYNCSCYPGYFGETCDYQRTSCKFSPCENGGFCENRTTTDEFKFSCHCRSGWNGTDCSQRVSPCEPNPCTARGFCSKQDDEFKCVCQPGYTGHRCEININDCAPNPCLNGGQCFDLQHGHVCRCVETHYGTNCQYTLSANGYSPVLDGIVTNVVLVRDGEGDGDTKTILSVVAGLVTAGVLVGIVVLVVCYLRTTETYRNISLFGGVRDLFKRKNNRDLTVQVNVTNTPDCPLTSDAFFQGSRSQLDLGLDNKAYQNELV